MPPASQRAGFTFYRVLEGTRRKGVWFMRVLDWVADILDFPVKHVSAFMTMLMSVIVILQVFFRYVIKGSLPWSEESARYLMIWLGFLGASRAFRQDRHIGMNVLVQSLPRTPKRIITFVMRLSAAGLLVFLAYLGFSILPGVAPERTPALNISLAWIYLAIPVGMILSAVQVLILALKELAAA